MEDQIKNKIEQRQRILEEDRHNEIKNALKLIADVLSKKDESSIKMLEGNAAILKSVISAVRDINISSPSVKVETNQDLVVNSLKNGQDVFEPLLKGIHEAIVELKREKKVVVHVRRGPGNIIESMTFITS